MLNSITFVLECASRMTWKGQSPEIHRLPEQDYPTGVKLSKQEMAPWESRLDLKPGQEKYDITIKPHPLPAV